MRRLVIIAIALMWALASSPGATAASLQGDKEAIALVERMLETLGGKDAWARARTISVEFTGYYAREQAPWHEVYWMDLESPRGRFELEGKTTNRVMAWTPDGGWEHNLKEESLENMDSERHEFELEYWKRQPVVLFHRLARGVPATKVISGDNEFRFDVFDVESDTLLAQFAVNMKAEPIKWGISIGEREMEHFFGPLQSYDGVRLWQWGGSISAV